MGNVRVAVDERGLREALHRGATPAVVALMRRAAQIAGASVDVESGSYRDGLDVVVERDGDAVGEIVARAGHSGFLEYGTVDTPAFAPLRRATESVFGLRNVVGGRR